MEKEREERVIDNEVTECVACGESDMFRVLDLGDQAPVNNIYPSRERADKEPVFPLALNACRGCGHGQLAYNVDPEVMFTEYSYVSGTSRTMMEHFERLARAVVDVAGPGGRIVEIGSNDGTFLDELAKGDVYYIGVDPAENLQDEVRLRGHAVITGFWPDCADKLGAGGKAGVDVFVGQNVFAHTPDPLSWLQACARLLVGDGVVMVQTSQADMVANYEFDTIYHEHYSFYNEHSMRALAERAGLHLLTTLYPRIHGGSSLYILGKHGWARGAVNRLELRVSELLESHAPAATLRHADLRIAKRSEASWREFGEKAEMIMGELEGASWTWRRQERRVIAAGVAAKGVTMLRASRVQPDVMLDENPLKIGRWVPGLDAQIESFESEVVNRVGGEENGSDCVWLLTAWNFKREIARKLLAAGADPESECVTYFPELRSALLGDVAEL